MSDLGSLSWRIEPGRVGIVELGKPLPEQLLTQDLAARYLAQYIADGVPVDGFQFDDPPLTVLVAGGPFVDFDRVTEDVEEPPVAALRDKGAAAARAGAAVSRIMITGPGPATAAGLGVGSTYEALQKAHPDMRLRPLPETLGDDLCVASSKALPGISFVFSTCRKAEKNDPVKRVDVWLPE